MFQSKYGVARHIYIPIPKAGSANHAVGADWTPAAGDVKISKDGGAAANVTNLPTAIAMGNSALWDFSLTATELQAAQVNVTVADSATKAVDDTGFIIETYGHASGQHEFDLDTPLASQTVGTVTTVSDKTGYRLSSTGVDDLWRETLADHSGVSGSTAAALNAAGSAGDPWSTALPGAYGAGTAGKIIGDNVNATISSRASQTSLDDVPTNAELATALAGADDAVLTAVSALNNLSAAGVRAAVGLASANLDTQLGDLPTNAEFTASQAAADDATLAAIAAVPAAVLAAATAAPIAADVKEINGTTVQGAGNLSDKWRPV